jgi:hypothetical protein
VRALVQTTEVPRNVRIELGGEVVHATEAEWMKAADALVQKHGGIPDVTRNPVSGPASIDTLVESEEWVEPVCGTCGKHHEPTGCKWYSNFPKNEELAVEAPKYSRFGEGNQVTDAAAKARIEAQQAHLIANGVNVDATQQLFATGTRMAAEGYATQESRRREHEQQMPARDAAEQLASTVKAEGRRDIEVSSRELAKNVHANGKITLGGYRLTETAIRGLCTRLDSPAMRYLLGLRDRIAAELALPLTAAASVDNPATRLRDPAKLARDKAQFVEVLSHELATCDEQRLKLRVRENGQHDIFAVVSTGYAPADAPEVVAQIVGSLPPDTRGTWAYDPITTTWELRASIWTPTPVEQQAVGEAFQGYARFGSRDNGTGRLEGGGGVMMLRCLNASTYVAPAANLSRVHRGAIMVDVDRMIAQGRVALDALCGAWGVARATEVPLPKDDDGAPIPLEIALPGWCRHLVRETEMAVFPGRTEVHVAELARAFVQERRDPDRIVRSDFAQAFTRLAQAFEPDVRRDAEKAAGAWLTRSRPLGYSAA